MTCMSINAPDENAAQPDARRRDWRRVHHSPLFWVGALLSLAAISVYVFSEDLSLRPPAFRNAPSSSPAAPRGAAL
jgi:hypothetical protein